VALGYGLFVGDLVENQVSRETRSDEPMVSVGCQDPRILRGAARDTALARCARLDRHSGFSRRGHLKTDPAPCENAGPVRPAPCPYGSRLGGDMPHPCDVAGLEGFTLRLWCPSCEFSLEAHATVNPTSSTERPQRGRQNG
jgi:hypothetical protein